MTVDEVFIFVTKSYSVITERDFESFRRWYDFTDDDIDELKKKLEEDGWENDGDTWM